MTNNTFGLKIEIMTGVMKLEIPEPKLVVKLAAVKRRWWELWKPLSLQVTRYWIDIGYCEVGSWKTPEEAAMWLHFYKVQRR